MPSGVLIQWGQATINAGGAAPITWPRPFPTAVASVTANAQWHGPRGIVVTIGNLTPTSGSVWAVYAEGGSAAVNVTVLWMAIGF